MREAIVAAGIERPIRSWHDLRHTALTHDAGQPSLLSFSFWCLGLVVGAAVFLIAVLVDAATQRGTKFGTK